MNVYYKYNEDGNNGLTISFEARVMMIKRSSCLPNFKILRLFIQIWNILKFIFGLIVFK